MLNSVYINYDMYGAQLEEALSSKVTGNACWIMRECQPFMELNGGLVMLFKAEITVPGNGG